MNCNACSRQFLCELVNNYSDTSQCKKFKRIRGVKVRRQEDENTKDIKQKQ